MLNLMFSFVQKTKQISLSAILTLLVLKISMLKGLRMIKDADLLHESKQDQAANDASSCSKNKAQRPMMCPHAMKDKSIVD